MSVPERPGPSADAVSARLDALRQSLPSAAPKPIPSPVNPPASTPVKPPAGAPQPTKSSALGRDTNKGTEKARVAEPISWLNALIVMLVLATALWIIQIVNAANDYRLDRFGLRPRELNGLEGVLTSPFLHASYGHLLTNTAPFVLLGWAVLISGVRNFLLSSAIIIVVGGLATWLVAPSGLTVGASGLIMGWLGYLLARAVFSRRIVWIVVAVLVLFFFSGLLGGLLPSLGTDLSWQGHICGFLAGVLAGWVLHPRKAKRAPRTVS